MGYLLRIASEPARRFKLLWYFVAWACAGLYVAIGSTYIAGGTNAVQGSSLATLLLIERDLRIHGGVMLLIGIFLVYGLNDYRRITRWALILMLFYSVWVAVLLLGQHFAAAGAGWTGPWWYLFVAVLCGGLLVLAPPLNRDGTRYRGGPREGSGRA